MRQVWLCKQTGLNLKVSQGKVFAIAVKTCLRKINQRTREKDADTAANQQRADES